jgi:quinolinate synthase
MQTATIAFDRFNSLADNDAGERIRAAKARLGERCSCSATTTSAPMSTPRRHHRRLAEALAPRGRPRPKHIVFCGVHFMAEVADILTRPEQIAILPDLAAGCSMADMASLAKVERAWRELSAVLDPDEKVTPVTYINSAADLKAFCGAHGGIVCTSSNAPKILEWSFQQREKVLFFPDQHLGRWSGYKMGIPLDEMVVWDPDLEIGGLTREQIRNAKIILWKGFCSVHQMFQPSDIITVPQPVPDGKVISHPECSFEVCKQSDYIGSPSTSSRRSRRLRPARAGWSAPSSTWSSAWRRSAKHEGKIVQFMAPPSACARPCSASTRSTWPGRWKTWSKARW